MKRLSQTNQFLRDIKQMAKRGKDLNKLKQVVQTLSKGMPLGPKYRDHPLVGPWKNCRDCHVEPDWILIYSSDSTQLRLERTGTHSDLII